MIKRLYADCNNTYNQNGSEVLNEEGQKGERKHRKLSFDKNTHQKLIWITRNYTFDFTYIVNITSSRLFKEKEYDALENES